MVAEKSSALICVICGLFFFCLPTGFGFLPTGFLPTGFLPTGFLPTVNRGKSAIAVLFKTFRRNVDYLWSFTGVKIEK
jgi:hypothetical protein